MRTILPAIVLAVLAGGVAADEPSARATEGQGLPADDMSVADLKALRDAKPQVTQDQLEALILDVRVTLPTEVVVDTLESVRERVGNKAAMSSAWINPGPGKHRIYIAQLADRAQEAMFLLHEAGHVEFGDLLQRPGHTASHVDAEAFAMYYAIRRARAVSLDRVLCEAVLHVEAKARLGKDPKEREAAIIVQQSQAYNDAVAYLSAFERPPHPDAGKGK